MATNSSSPKPSLSSFASISDSTAASTGPKHGRQLRRDSLISRSPSASSQVNTEQFAQKLNDIHTLASQTDTLTVFNDFGSPLESFPATESKGIAGDLVRQGFSGLYSRFKDAVGVGVAVRQDGDDCVIQDFASRHSSDTANIAFEAPSHPRVETGASSDTPTPATMTNTTGSRSLTQSTTVTTASTMGISKSPHRQGLPRAPHAIAAVALDPTVAPGFVQRGTGRSTRSAARSAEENRGRGLSTSRGLENAESDSLCTVSGLETSGVGDGAADTPLSLVRSIEASSVQSNEIGDSKSSAKTLAATDRIAYRRSPSNTRSRSSSREMGTAKTSPTSVPGHDSIYHGSFAHETRLEQSRLGDLMVPGATMNDGAPEQVNARLEIMRKQVVSKEFWMADETSKECFLCGDVFTIVRRKHHCRTCGCIFDSKCTSIISGQKFGVSGHIRVCKSCLTVINRRYDNSGSDDSSDDSGYLPVIFRSQKAIALSPRKKNQASNDADLLDGESQRPEIRSAQTPMMAIPATRRMGDSNRHSAILEIDMPQLSRPSSSRPLTSSRPRSPGHKRLQSEHNLLGKLKGTPENRAPFRKWLGDDKEWKAELPAFHADNIIDPELAAYMSEESSGDEQMSISAAMSNSGLPTLASYDNGKSNFRTLLSAGKKHHIRDKSISGTSFTSRSRINDHTASASHLRPQSSRLRNLSNVGSEIHHMRSPRLKSGVFKLAPSVSNEMLYVLGNPNVDTTMLTRSDSFQDHKEPQIELSPSSKKHVKKLLQQLLQDAGILNVTAWDETLIPILLQCTDNVTPDLRSGDDMDIRRYVKFKKIPGGKLEHTSYVSGVIFTKNLALKSMPRTITRPRIVIVSFPIEYQRHQQHFMSLQPVIEQEKEFLRIVINRIVNLQPHVLLAEKSVSGIAFEMLSAANVAVAYNVKQSVIEAVSRCTKADIISSLDMLALPVRVGFCEGFKVKTFLNNDYPSKKKSYIFLSGCDPSLGGTIALRGATTHVLSKMKRITDFMVYVIYNLKLETCLMRDEFLDVPADIDDNSLPPARQQLSDDTHRTMARPGSSALSGVPNHMRPTVVINMAMGEPSTQSSMDTSQSSREMSPVREKAPLTRLVSLHQNPENHDVADDSPIPEDVPMPTFYSDMVARYTTKILSASPFVNFRLPYVLVRAREQERRLVYLKRLRDQDMVEVQDTKKAAFQPFQLVKPEMIHAIGHQGPKHIMEVIYAVHNAEYDKALYNYQTYTRQWENYIQGNLDLFDPYSHQNIVVLYSVICTETKIPCIEPGLMAISFYDEQHEDAGMDADCTLGQYLEGLWYCKDEICSAHGCDKPLFEHHRTYVHNESRITVVLETIPQKSTKHSNDDQITMWSYCKVCDRDFPIIPMSESTWKYSFGKYLELLFWSNSLRLNNQANCLHNHNQDHIRYFAFLDLRVRIHYDPIDLLEIIAPRPRITWKVEHDLNLKNDVFTKIEDRWNRFITSVKSRLKGIRIDVVLPEKAETCKVEVERLTEKVREDYSTLIRKLQDTYVNSKYYEVIPFNAVIQEMLQYAEEWDAAFAKFESDFLPDKDVRLLTMLQLKKMFPDSESRESLPAAESIASTVGSEERPSQISTESEEPSTQPTDYTNPSLAESAMSARSDEAESSSGDFKAIIPAERVIERMGPLGLATSVSPSMVASSHGPAAALASTPRQPSREQSKASSRDELSMPKSPSPLQDAPHHRIELARSVSSLREKPEPPQKEGQVAEPPAPSTIPDVSKGDKGDSSKAGLTISPPTNRLSSRPIRQLLRSQSAKGKDLKDGEVAAVEPSPEGTIKVDKKLSNRLVTVLKSRMAAQSAIPRFVRREPRVSILTRHFEQLSKEFENQRIEDRKKRAEKLRQRQPRTMLPRSSTKAIVEVYDDVDEAVQEPGPSDYDQKPDQETETPASEPYSAKEPQPSTPSTTVPTNAIPTPTEKKAERRLYAETATDGETDDNVTVQANHDGSEEDGEGPSDTEPSLNDFIPDITELADSLEPSAEGLPKLQKSSLLKMLTNFWAERSSSGWQPLDYPVNVTDHLFIDSDIIVREDEPSSLIAFVLNSEDYQARLAHTRPQWHPKMQTDYEEGEAKPKSLSALEPMGQDVEAELEKSLLQGTQTHLKYQFTKGSAKMLCKIFYAEQFDAIRRKTGVADRIVESLSRCLKWDSRGGKSQAIFLKTLDDRFILKSLSAVETAAFFSFAPAYFSIIIFIKNPATNTDIKLDLLVMENLFYDRSPSRIFDLKGSMRNRKIHSTSQQNEVLLDENMVEFIYESPLFVREHSKKLLQLSVWNDTLFLERQNVMDYSLMIAIDEMKKELVVGIVDYIRTYTLDKKLESWIKDRGFAGGGRNRATITRPKEYKSRFREAMKRYILQAPSHWHQFGLPDPGS